MEATFGIQPATNGGTGPWALSLMATISKYPVDLSTEEILLVFQCLRSLSSSSFISIPAVDFWLFIFIEYGNTPEICSEGIITLNNLVSKYQDVYHLIHQDYMKEILCRLEKTNILSADEVFKCRSILEYGIDGIKLEETNSYLFLPAMLKMLKTK